MSKKCFTLSCVKVDSLTFDSKKAYRKKILARLPLIFAYPKPPSILKLRRQIVQKHLLLPRKRHLLGAFWRKETFLLKKLIDKFPAEDFWLKVNFKPMTIKLKYGEKEQQLHSFSQFFAWPFKDQLEQKYQQLKYKVKTDDEIKLSDEKCGDDVIIKRKPKSIKDFLNG